MAVSGLCHSVLTECLLNLSGIRMLCKAKLKGVNVRIHVDAGSSNCAVNVPYMFPAE